MSEARELFEALADQLKKLAHLHVTKGNRDVAAALSNTRNAIAEALATQPEPGDGPELPLSVTESKSGKISITLSGNRVIWFDAEDVDDVLNACRILAARERARRAGS